MYLIFVNGARKKKQERAMRRGEWIASSESILWKIQNILVPCIALVPSCRQFTIASRQEAELIQKCGAGYVFPRGYRVDDVSAINDRGYLSEFSSTDGTETPSVQPTGKAFEFIQKWMDALPKGKKVVTVTLRECDNKPLRNSNVESWAAFARSLDLSVYYPVFVRDTYAALDPLPEALKGLHIFREIPWHVDLRAALYEKSYLNLFVNNGPDVLCILNRNTRYIVFKMITPEYQNTSAGEFDKTGFLSLGESWGGANEFQHLVWEEGDALETIRREFTRMCERIEKRSVLPQTLEKIN